MTVNWAWWRRWTVLLSGLACLQLAVQACNAVTGFLLVRWLPREEYSLFTLTGSLLTLMVLFTDLGLTVGLVSIGGRVWADRARHAALVADGVLLRRQLYIVTALVMAPVGYWLPVPRSMPALSGCMVAIARCRSPSSRVLRCDCWPPPPV
jgi:hypothetical protein